MKLTQIGVLLAIVVITTQYESRLKRKYVTMSKANIKALNGRYI